MNVLQLGMTILGAASVLLSHPMPAPAAFKVAGCLRFQYSTLDATPRLRYYKLDLAACTNCPDDMRQDIANAASLSPQKFELMKVVLQRSIARYNLKNKANADFQIRRQHGVRYAPYLGKKGRKLIWINGYCDDKDPPSDKEMVNALDGGPCFFNTTILLGSSELVSLGIHGFG